GEAAGGGGGGGRPGVARGAAVGRAQLHPGRRLHRAAPRVRAGPLQAPAPAPPPAGLPARARLQGPLRRRRGGHGGDRGAAVGQLRASTLVVGLHDKSFLYGSPGPYEGVSGLGCRVLAVRQHATARHGAVEAELTQVETIRLHVPPPKIPFPIFALPLGVIWRRSSSSKKRR
ncbi:hypothetical protein CFC21_033296, partial [Triticum aestivum]